MVENLENNNHLKYLSEIIWNNFLIKNNYKL